MAVSSHPVSVIRKMVNHSELTVLPSRALHSQVPKLKGCGPLVGMGEGRTVNPPHPNEL